MVLSVFGPDLYMQVSKLCSEYTRMILTGLEALYGQRFDIHRGIGRERRVEAGWYSDDLQQELL